MRTQLEHTALAVILVCSVLAVGCQAAAAYLAAEVERSKEGEARDVRLTTEDGDAVTLRCPAYTSRRLLGGHGRECYILLDEVKL